MSASLKSAILDVCKEQIDAKINLLHSEFNVYKDAVANETKSTAGDKHDTSRSMMQLEQEKMGVQLKELQRQKKILDSIEISEPGSQLRLGSIVRTDHGNFFISVFARPIVILNETFIPVSLQSPIAQLISKSKPGFDFVFNGKIYKIESIH